MNKALFSPSSEVVHYPSLIRRIAAMIYDGFLACALCIFVVAIMVFLRVQLGQPMATNEIAINARWQWPTFITCIISLCLFFSFFWVKNGQTLGMQAWKMKIVSKDSLPISWKQAILRYFLAWLSFGCFFIGYFWVLFDAKKQTLHDKLTKTYVIKLE